MDDKKITVLLVEPMKKPEVIETGTELKDMQDIVEGLIEVITPFEDDVAIVANEEGKIMRLPPNRALCDDDKRIVDIIHGKFFITYAPIESESFESLPKDMQEKYAEKFKYPEQFLRTKKGIIAIPMKPAREDLAR